MNIKELPSQHPCEMRGVIILILHCENGGTDIKTSSQLIWVPHVRNLFRLYSFREISIPRFPAQVLSWSLLSVLTRSV